MFRAPCAHRQEVKIVLYRLWYRHTYRWPSDAQVERVLSHTDKRAEPESVRKGDALSDFEEHWTDKYLICCLQSLNYEVGMRIVDIICNASVCTSVARIPEPRRYEELKTCVYISLCL